MFVLCGDYELNELKVEKYLFVDLLFEMVKEEDIVVVIGVKLGLLGFVGLMMLIIVDCFVNVFVDFVVGVNKDGEYYSGINWDCDVENYEVVDICNIVEGDLSLCG